MIHDDFRGIVFMKLHLDKSCNTCENNIDGKCSNKYYGEDISTNPLMQCDEWDIGFDYYKYVMENLPWYLQKRLNHGTSYSEIISLIEMDEKGLPIELDIFEVIEEVYGLKYPTDFSYVLGVKNSVVYYAHTHSVPQKRLNHFANTFCISGKYFYNISTLDLNEIEKCKIKFFKKQNKTLREIHDAALNESLERSEKIQACENKKNKGVNIKNFKNKLNHFKSTANLIHDISDDYKSRDYVVEITLQKYEFKGHIYYEYNYNKFGLDRCIIEDLLDFIKRLDAETIRDYNETYDLINDMKINANEDNTISFVLCSDEGEKLNISIPSEDLSDYIVGYKIIECVGHGKKKETRRCRECLNFSPYDDSNKGFCGVKKQSIYGSRIICAFDFVASTKNDK